MRFHGETVHRSRMAPNRRIAGYYAVGALLTVLLTTQGWPWTAALLWPAVSLALVSAAYLGVGPAIYGKRNGRLPLGSRVLFAPTLAGQYASLWYYRRHSTAWDRVVPGLLIGRTLTAPEATALLDHGVTAVLDLTAEFSEHAALRRLAYRNIPLLDLTAPTMHQLHAAVDFIRGHIAAGHVVYVHCKVGYSRTATAVGAYLIASGQCTSLDEALALLRAARPGIVIRPEALHALQAFQHAPPRPAAN
jgi:protein-tyrosine phosphatase